MKFDKWLREFEIEYEKELKNWHTKSGYKSLLLPGLKERVIQQYSAYRNEMATRKLVIATWVLAVFTIILSLISLILR